MTPEGPRHWFTGRAPGTRRTEEHEASGRGAGAWLVKNAIPLRGVEPRAGFDDLRPLKEIFAGVRVVGLGEATHGTREFFLLKHRLLEFLVEEMGFTVFGIESDHAACLAINRYVLRGEGDAAEALAGQGFWTWNTEEVLVLDAEPPGTKMVVWAHNGHVSKSAIFGGVPSMGRHLRDAFGEGYYAAGLTFDRGSFQAIRFGLGRSTLAEYTVSPAVEGSVERCLVRAGLGDCLIDLRRAREDKGMRAWLSEKRPMRSIGATARWLWKYLSYVPTALAEHYDGLVFVGETTRARPVHAF